MSYSDIVELVKHDDCNKIIHAIRKTPGLVRYESGEFKYTEAARSPVFKFIDRWVYRIGSTIFIILIAISLTMLAFGELGTAIAGFFGMIFGASMLAIQLRDYRHDQMISNIITPSPKE